MQSCSSKPENVLFLKYHIAFVLALTSPAVVAETSAEIPCDSKNQRQEFEFVTHDIFDLKADDVWFFHHWANDLKIPTKPITIENEMAFAFNKCHLDDEDLYEIERSLRSLSYIQDANVEQTAHNKVKVEVWDTWTLLPTINISREGGQNDIALGMRDRNLLGYGVFAQLETFSDEQRDGFRFNTEFPLFLNKNIKAGLRWVDANDGNIVAASLVRPFVSFSTPTAFLAYAEDGRLSQTFFLNGDDFYDLFIDTEQFQFQWGWLHNNGLNSVTRSRIGIDSIQKQFSADGDFAPRDDIRDRHYITPFYELEYQQKAFRELKNVRLINQPEDVNLGWHGFFRIGVNVNEQAYDEALVRVNATASKGYGWGDSLLSLNRFSVQIDAVDTDTPRVVFRTTNELIQRYTDKIGFYFKHEAAFSENPFFDQPITVGGTSGVRGYPLEFQRGNHKIALSAEARWYPNVSIAQLLQVGGVAFIDAGRTFKSDAFPNQTEGWLSSIGIGARLYAQKSAETHVVHFDIAFPLQSHPEVSNVEFRITASDTF